MAVLAYDTTTGVVFAIDTTPSAPQDLVAAYPGCGTFAFDETTNYLLYYDILFHISSYSVVSGALTKGGQTVTVSAPGSDYQNRAFVEQAASVFIGTETLPSNATIKAAIQAVQAGTATNAQAQLALAATMRAFGWAVQRLLSSGGV